MFKRQNSCVVAIFVVGVIASFIQSVMCINNDAVAQVVVSG